LQKKDTIRRKQLLNRADLFKLFSNIEEILSVHEILMKELDGGRGGVGLVFTKMAHYLKIYSVYCANYPTAVTFLQSRKVCGPKIPLSNVFRLVNLLNEICRSMTTLGHS